MTSKSQEAFAFRLQKLRRALLKSLPRVYPNEVAAMVSQAITDQLFPFTFLLRNVLLLDREPHWLRLLPKAKKLALLRLLQERSTIFCQVRDWLRQQGKEPALSEAILVSSANKADHLSYCTHCGGCCEIAGGLPDFPEGVEIPLAWMNLFGTGLGLHHRFCPFLWEVNGAGLSLCAIHAWRPNPCRLFAKDECRYLTDDVDFKTLLDPALLLQTCSRLCRLMNGR